MTDASEGGVHAAVGPAATVVSAAVPAGEKGPGLDVNALLFDQALAELRDVVARLEAGGMPLEESIALYERGAALHEHCARLLDSAELRVQRLVEDGGGSARLVDLRPDDAEDS